MAPTFRNGEPAVLFVVNMIAEETIKVPDLTDSAIYKLRKHVEQIDDSSEEDEDVGDDFENLYKGEISKSGTPILPSKRARKIPEKIQVSKEDLAELQNTDAPQSNDAPAEEGGEEESNEVSLDEIAENDQQEADNSENSEQ